MRLNFKHLKHLGTAFLAVVVLAAALPSLAAANSTQVLQDVEQATLQAGEQPAIGSLAAVKDGGQVSTKTLTGIDLAVPAGKITNTTAGTLVKGEGQSDIVFQSVGVGTYRASVHISSPSDPECYEFNVRGASRLLKQFDGSVQAYDATGQLVAEIETPWAKDKDGKDVPTHYKVGGAVLTQVVEHRGGGFVYGVVADPYLYLISPTQWVQKQVGAGAGKAGKWGLDNAGKVAKCSAWVAVNFGGGIGWVKRIGGTAKAIRVLQNYARQGKKAWHKYLRDAGLAFGDFEGFKVACT